MILVFRCHIGMRPTDGLPQSVAVSIHLEDMHVWVRRSSRAPVRRSERKMRNGRFDVSDDDRTALVSLREDLEEELGADLGQGDVAEFIDDQELDALPIRLLVKDILVGDDKIIIRHSIPLRNGNDSPPTQSAPPVPKLNISALVANLYMRRFMLGWKRRGLETVRGAKLVAV